MRPHSSQESSSEEDPGFSTATREKTKVTKYSDSSGAVFLYIGRAEKFDEENWKGGAKDPLFCMFPIITTGQLLAYPFYAFRPAFSHLLWPSFFPRAIRVYSKTPMSLPNPSLPKYPISVLAPRILLHPAESPSTNAQASFNSSAFVFVNSVWFIGPVLSLTCALMATLLQQWAPRYLQLTHRKHPPHVRAHIREYFACGAARFHISTLVGTLPALLFISVLFFSGLVVYAYFGAPQIP